MSTSPLKLAPWFPWHPETDAAASADYLLAAELKRVRDVLAPRPKVSPLDCTGEGLVGALGPAASRPARGRSGGVPGFPPIVNY